ncbi:MAG: hypothetical protein QN122_08940 [Armatimonadota bacterium]|nr:hypothetical protein [Armatimonadota bacterium]MDR7448148.1 hypothetical protein [Armatimonadota bacterium]MDR7460486.1 hypothetical protein [Armatimonadota bacterium]MDR7478241.1 hypothetical protein [Armatimonadota bacterium]MDR7488854.1 hypothetical protein [Armatimonadota bacterium]
MPTVVSLRTTSSGTRLETLPVRVDKSRLVTIGERLYAESLELVRELVNNAYDADATEVRGEPAPPRRLCGRPVRVSPPSGARPG